MRIIPSSLLAVTVSALLISPLGAQDAQEPRALHGPATAKLSDVAQLQVPTGYIFLDGKTTRK
jgi:hypothetical protein